MITPLDIQNKNFKKTFRGFSPKEVNSFLNEMIDDYERMYKENIEYKDKINMLTDQIRQFQTMEETLKSTLLVAQQAADEVTVNARNKAEIIIENAEDTGRRIIDQSREDVRSIKDEYEHLQKELFIFKTRYESFLKSQLFSLDEYYKSEKKVETIEDNSEDMEVKE
ncbi:MAG TPA: DivIVA domain-containing protein [Tissierellaceae bacterium]|jgi:cell division initiation protein|nr:DivIVA domain-containing protein [Tissierellaceae bacterium]